MANVILRGLGDAAKTYYFRLYRDDVSPLQWWDATNSVWSATPDSKVITATKTDTGGDQATFKASVDGSLLNSSLTPLEMVVEFVESGTDELQDSDTLRVPEGAEWDTGAPTPVPTNMFVSNDTIIAIMETMFHKQGNNLFSDDEKQIIRDANAAAFNMLYGYLRGVGILPAQILTWNRGPEFQTDLAIFKSCQRLGFYKATDPGVSNPLDRFNRKKDLDDIFSDDSTTAIVAVDGTILYDRTTGGGFAVADVDPAEPPYTS